MTTRQCAHCGNEMQPASRSHAKYCGASCRVMASKARKNTPAPAEPVETPSPAPVAPVELFALPAALTRLPRWIRRTANKVPLTVDGDTASSTDPSTWSSFSDAEESSAGVGLGFVFNGDGIGCIDLDHCLVDGVPTADAEAFLATVPDTYIEVSPSGDGLHIFGKGVYLTARKSRHETLQGEVMGSKKYVTITGRRFRESPPKLANISAPAGALTR